MTFAVKPAYLFVATAAFWCDDPQPAAANAARARRRAAVAMTRLVFMGQRYGGEMNPG